VLAGSVRSRADWRHAENDVDLLVIDFDPLDEETDQVAPEMPISFRQTISYLLSEIAQLPDDEVRCVAASSAKGCFWSSKIWRRCRMVRIRGSNSSLSMTSLA